ncbi:MAG: hypothetical protein ACUZ8H_14010 [Candidatus Anammoxibacter sp.]
MNKTKKVKLRIRIHIDTIITDDIDIYDYEKIEEEETLEEMYESIINDWLQEKQACELVDYEVI